MNFENEITVEVDTSLEDLTSILEKKGFELKESYDLNDIYLINKEEKSNDYLSMLNKCVLIRHIIEEKPKLLICTYHKPEDLFQYVGLNQ